MRNAIKTSFSIALGALVLVGSAAVLAGQAPNKPEAPSTRQKQVAALRSRGLPAAAAITGSFIAEENPHVEREAKSLANLVDESEVIVVGRITNSTTWVDADARVVTTDYAVVPEKVLKGKVPPDGIITVSILGGRVSFPDGSVAEIRTPGLPRPLDGQRFVLFLKKTRYNATPAQIAAAHGQLFAPVLTSQGVFHLSPSKGVEPRARHGHPVRRLYAGKPEQILIADVKSAVGERPTK